MDIRAIIFDKDGTLIDFAETFNPATRKVLYDICNGDADLMKRACDVLGYDFETGDIDPNSVVIAGSGEDISRVLQPILGFKDTVDFARDLDRLYGEVCIETVVALPGISTALVALKQAGIMLGIGTNDSEENAKSQMQTLGFLELFDHVYGADSGFGAKPGPGMVTAFIGQTEIAPEHVLMVGDSLHDLDAGKAAGAYTCAVETGPGNHDALHKAANFVLPSVAELPEYLKASM